MNNLEIARRHFKNLGFSGRYNRELHAGIKYKFDIFSKGRERNAVYVLRKPGLFDPLADIASLFPIIGLPVKMCLCIPATYKISLESQAKAANNNVDIYSIKGTSLDLLVPGRSKSSIQKASALEIINTLKHINTISRFKWGIAIFKIDSRIIHTMKYKANDEAGFIIQITLISSILDSINAKDMRKVIPSLTLREKEFFSKHQTINVLNTFLLKKTGSSNLILIKALRELRILRNMFPVHPSKEYKAIFQKYLGRLPKTDEDWSELSEIVFTNFKGALILLRNIIK